MGVSERVIRYWKKHPVWETERQKLIDERAEAMGLKDRQRREEFKEKLKKQEQNLEILMEQVYVNAMRAITISNKALAAIGMMNDPLKACSIALKSGTHIHTKAAIQGINAYIAIIKHLHQFHILLEYFESLEEDDEE